MTQAFLPLGHDYAVLSLSALRAPVIERLVVGIQVVDGLQGVMVAEEEFDAGIEEQAQMLATVVEEDSLAATIEVEDMEATIVQVDDMAGIFEECP